jgi:hypothetical protein
MVGAHDDAVTPRRCDLPGIETYRNGNLGGVRQRIESVNQTLIWHNWTTGVTSKRSLIAFDH